LWEGLWRVGWKITAGGKCSEYTRPDVDKNAEGMISNKKVHKNEVGSKNYLHDKEKDLWEPTTHA
jgi:hypothetical protein